MIHKIKDYLSTGGGDSNPRIGIPIVSLAKLML